MAVLGTPVVAGSVRGGGRRRVRVVTYGSPLCTRPWTGRRRGERARICFQHRSQLYATQTDDIWCCRASHSSGPAQ
jgi:hypothetical protein